LISNLFSKFIYIFFVSLTPESLIYHNLILNFSFQTRALVHNCHTLNSLQGLPYLLLDFSKSHWFLSWYHLEFCLSPTLSSFLAVPWGFSFSMDFCKDENNCPSLTSSLARIPSDTKTFLVLGDCVSFFIIWVFFRGVFGIVSLTLFVSLYSVCLHEYGDISTFCVLSGWLVSFSWLDYSISCSSGLAISWFICFLNVQFCTLLTFFVLFSFSNCTLNLYDYFCSFLSFSFAALLQLSASSSCSFYFWFALYVLILILLFSLWLLVSNSLLFDNNSFLFSSLSIFFHSLSFLFASSYFVGSNFNFCVFSLYLWRFF
jgi:hypothetical protein